MKKLIWELTIGCARKLFDQGAKGLVVACNTATSAAVRKLREMYPYIPIVGIEPALKPAALCMEHPKVLVMATPMTIHEEKFHVLMERYKEKAQILPLPCPGLMDFIERGDLDGEDLHKYLEDLLYSYRENQVDAAVLGCTHYPFARKQIQQVLGENVKIFDGGEGTAREMKRRLQEKDLLCGRQKRGQVVYGHDGFAGELGHVIVRRDGRICGCGRKGCLETYCSATGVARTAREFLAARTDASLLRNIPAESIVSKDVYDAAVQGDKLAQEIFEFTGNILGEALADAIAFSSPEAIILFGGLAKSGDYIMKPIMKAMENNLLNIYKGKAKLLVSELKDSDAAVLGASALAWELKDLRD